MNISWWRLPPAEREKSGTYIPKIEPLSAISAASPPEDPPADRLILYGFKVLPYGLIVSRCMIACG